LRNVWISRWRKSHLELPLAEAAEEQIEPYYDWEDEFLRDEMSAQIEQALSDLPADYRLTILLADVEELTYEEIARVMECPIGTVMSRLNRGRKMLARLIRSYDQERSSGPKPEAIIRRKS
jgi:RNA polymerase sigma-70 factor (ECF subfamily)